MKLPELLKQIQFLTNGMTSAQMEKVGIKFERFEEKGDYIKIHKIKHVEYDERFNQIIFTEDNAVEDEDKNAVRLTDKYSRD